MFVAPLSYPTRSFASRLLIVFLIASVSWFGLPGYSEEEVDLAPSDNSSPRDTLESFIRLSDDIYKMIRDEAKEKGKITEHQGEWLVEELLRNLDLSEEAGYLYSAMGKEGAVCIKEILDRTELPPTSEIPGFEEVSEEGEMPGLERWRIPGTDLVIHRITEGPRIGDYLFSPASIDKAVANYDIIRRQPYKRKSSPNFYAWYLTHPGPGIEPWVEKLPHDFRTRMVGRQALWQWIALGIVIVLSFFTIILAYYLGRRISGRRKQRSAIGYGLTLFYPILAMLVPLGFSHLIEHEIRIAGTTLSVLTFAANTVMLLASMVVINGLGNRIAEVIISRPSIPEKGLDAQLIRIIARVVSLVLAVIVFLEGGKYLGIPLSTLLASAGVGGLAFALAAQESLKNFFGSIMIYMDKPFRIGERVLVQDYDGVVEEIGLRSTRLRLLNGHQATIPNEEMAATDIENVSRRSHIRRKADLRLPIDTSPEKVEEALEIVRKLLSEHEGYDENFPPRVYFTEILTDSLNIRFFYWYHPAEYWDFLGFSEKLNLDIQKEFRNAGIQLAVPLQIRQFEESAAPLQEPESASDGDSGVE